MGIGRHQQGQKEYRFLTESLLRPTSPEFAPTRCPGAKAERSDKVQERKSRGLGLSTETHLNGKHLERCQKMLGEGFERDGEILGIDLPTSSGRRSELQKAEASRKLADLLS